MSASLYFDRPDLVAQLRGMIARVPAVPAKIALAFLAGAASVSVIALATSAPKVESASPAAIAQPAVAAPQVAAVQAPAAQPEPARSCKEQTWPYVDRSCAQQPANTNQPPRAVRVISTDRVAPATLHAAPVVLAAQGEATQPAAAASSAVDDAQQQAPAGTSVASLDPNEVVPMPTPRPQMTAATRAPKARRVVVTLPPAGAPIRAEDDDDDGVRVRAYALPDGRRVTVYRYENPADRAVASRPDYYERRAFRSPFGGLFD